MDLQKVDLDELIKQLREQKEISNDRYLTEIINYFKWITTFDFTLLIWIGANIRNKVYNQNSCMFLSIVFIIFSIIIAIITTQIILDFWEKDRAQKFHVFQLAVAYQVNEKLSTNNSKTELDKQRKLSLESGQILFKLKNYSMYLILHIGTLFIGIIFYLFAVF